MGLDKFTPESLTKLTSKKEKKSNKSSKSKVSATEDEDSIPMLVPITEPTPKNIAKTKKAQNNKNVIDKTSASPHPKKETAMKNNQPKQNKKVVFDEAGNPVAKEIPTSNDQPKQNKRIIFDQSYLVNSSKNDATADSSSQPNSFKSGKPQQINFEKAKDGTAWYNLKIKPDVPWYQQGKKIKAGAPIASTDERTKIEEEGKKLLEEDAFNFKKGLIRFCFKLSN